MICLPKTQLYKCIQNTVKENAHMYDMFTENTIIIIEMYTNTLKENAHK